MGHTSVDPVRLTQTLVSFNTVNPPGNEHEAASYLEELLVTHGFHTEMRGKCSSRPNLIARLPATTPQEHRAPLVFSGHLDTVPLGNVAWRVNPFAGEVHDGHIYGRGSSDMKSGIAALVCSAIGVSQKTERQAAITLVLSWGEETGCEGVKELVSTPEALGDCGALIVAEPTSGAPLVGHKGTLWLKISVPGITAHGAMPENGVNAIYRSCDVISALRSLPGFAYKHAVMGVPTLNIGTISGGLNINSVPDNVEIGVDIRSVPGFSHEAVLRAIRQNLPSYCETTARLDLKPVYTDPEDPFVKKAVELCYRPSLPTKVAHYFTDAAVLQQHFEYPPTVILGPGAIDMAHRSNECCSIEDIIRCTEVYESIASWYVDAAVDL